jgi:hypothetical protein
VAELRLGWPLDEGIGWISGRFGEWYTGPNGSYQHRGLDIAAPLGVVISAPCDGRVVGFTNDGSYGPYAICLLHEGSGLYVLLAHNSASNVYVGQRVQRGQRDIGRVGSLGTSTGPHIHLQVCTTPTFPVNIAYSRDPEAYYHPEDDMPDPRTDKLIAAMGGEATIDTWNLQGNSLLAGYTNLYNEVVGMRQQLNQMQQTLQAVAQQTYGINDLLHAWRANLAMQGINVP